MQQRLFTANLDRFEVPPYGLAGGAPGRPGRLLLARAGSDEWQALPSKVSGIEMARGDGVRLETAGGGGHGNACERDPARVARDRHEGYGSDASST